MNTVDQARASQLANIQKKTGKSLEELTELVKKSGLTKHAEIRAMLTNALGLGYGDANTLTHAALNGFGPGAAPEQAPDLSAVLDEIYSGPKVAFRPIHERLMAALDGLGGIEIVPKKGYLSLRRKKQFAMLGPATNTRFELGLNIKELPPDERLLQQPAGSMCNFVVRLKTADEVTKEVIAWLRLAYESGN